MPSFGVGSLATPSPSAAVGEPAPVPTQTSPPRTDRPAESVTSTGTETLSPARTSASSGRIETSRGPFEGNPRLVIDQKLLMPPTLGVQPARFQVFTTWRESKLTMGRSTAFFVA